MRLCTFNGQTYTFHGFFQFSHAHDGSLMVGGFPPGVEAFPVPLIESEDGTVRYVRADEIRFEEGTEG